MALNRLGNHDTKSVSDANKKARRSAKIIPGVNDGDMNDGNDVYDDVDDDDDDNDGEDNERTDDVEGMKRPSLKSLNSILGTIKDDELDDDEEDKEDEKLQVNLSTTSIKEIGLLPKSAHESIVSESKLLLTPLGQDTSDSTSTPKAIELSALMSNNNNETVLEKNLAIGSEAQEPVAIKEKLVVPSSPLIAKELGVLLNDTSESITEKGVSISSSIKDESQKVQEGVPPVLDPIVDVNSFMYPDSVLRKLWDVVMGFILLYYAFMIPLRIALNLDPNIYFLDYALDLMFLADCYFHWTVFKTYSGGELVKATHEIREIYVGSRMKMDLVASFPYDIFALCFLGQPAMVLARAILRLPKIVRLPQIFILIKRLGSVFNNVINDFSLLPFLDLILAIFLIGHWVACGFFLFSSNLSSCKNNDYSSGFSNNVTAFAIGNGDSAGHVTPCIYHGTWIGNQIDLMKLPYDGGNQMTQFIRAINYAIPTLTANFVGDITPVNENDTIYAFIVMFCGISVFGTILGRVSSIASEETQGNLSILRKQDALRYYLVNTPKKIPIQQIQLATNFLNLLMSEDGKLTVQFSNLFKDFSVPNSLVQSLDQHVKIAPFLSNCPLFKSCPEDVLRALAARMKQNIFIQVNLQSYFNLTSIFFLICF
jgi:hypothetical protein